MEEVYSELFVGDDEDCFYEDKSDWAVVHACKEPCHHGQLGYDHELSPDHPDYYSYRRDQHLFLNLIVPVSPHYKKELFTQSAYFIDEFFEQINVLVHSNEGISRAPTLALLYLAASHHIDGRDFQRARQEFEQMYPPYNPTEPLEKYLEENWTEIFS